MLMLHVQTDISYRADAESLHVRLKPYLPLPNDFWNPERFSVAADILQSRLNYLNGIVNLQVFMSPSQDYVAWRACGYHGHYCKSFREMHKICRQ